MLSLKGIELKDEYRSDTDNITEDFLIPCLENCTEYHRCAETFSVKALIMMATRLDNITDGTTVLRMVISHRLRVNDLNMLTKLFSEGAGLPKGERMEVVQQIKDAVRRGSIQVRVAVPDSDHIIGFASERVGIFRDGENNMVAFTGTFREAITSHTKEFESIDVFTSWNDMARVKRKMGHFEQLWQNKAEHLDVYDFMHAERKSLLKYSSDWLMQY